MQTTQNKSRLKTDFYKIALLLRQNLSTSYRKKKKIGKKRTGHAKIVNIKYPTHPLISKIWYLL